MSVARCLEINRRLRVAGITVHEWPGWESRGNGQASAYEGCLVHHTATAFGMAPSVLVNGRPDLSGPLCNYAGNADGSVTVIAAHPANHAGASGGRSMGPLPVTSRFNKRVLGLEVVYPGTVPMRDAQYRTALLWSRIVTDVLGGGNIQRARAHAETSVTGKWDPGDAPNRTINMAAFRSAAAIVGANEEDVMNEQQYKVLVETQRRVSNTYAVAVENQRRMGLNQAALLAAIAADKDIDPAELARVIEAAVAAHTPTAAETAAVLLPLVEDIAGRVLGTDNKALAAEFIRQLRDALPANEGNPS